MTIEQLETDRLVLEPIDESYAPLLYPQVSDPRLYEFIDEKIPPSVEVLEKRYKTWRSFWAENPNDLWLNWAARVRGTTEYAGWFQATVRPQYALIAYVVFVAHQRHGFAREACRAVIDHLIGAYRVRRIRVTIDPRNEPSIRLARTLGMAPAGSDAKDLLFELEAVTQP